MKLLKSNIMLFIGILIILLLVNGCAHALYPKKSDYCSMVINSLSVPSKDIEGRTYTLMSSMKNIDTKDIQFREYAAYVKAKLLICGYEHVDSGADLIILMAYGIGKPKVEISTRVHNTFGGYSYPVGFAWVHVPPITQTIRTRSTTYDRFCILEVYDSKDMKSQLCRTIVKSEGSSSDLRKVLPSMLVSAITLLFENTKGEEGYYIHLNAPEVLEVKHIIDQSVPITERRLGVDLINLEPEDQIECCYRIVEPVGVYVSKVHEGSIAQEIGIKREDIILMVNNIPITKISDLANTISDIAPGKKMHIYFYDLRRGIEKDVSIRLK